MIEHIKSIRNWHYVLVILAVAGLALVIDQSRTQRTKDLFATYLRLGEQADRLSANHVFADSVDAVIQKHCAGTNNCHGKEWVREFLLDEYSEYVNMALAEPEELTLELKDTTTIPLKAWIHDKTYTNAHLFTFARRTEHLPLLFLPIVSSFVDSAFAFVNRQDKRFILLNPFPFDEEASWRAHDDRVWIRLNAFGIMPDSFMVALRPSPEVFSIESMPHLNDTVWLNNDNGQRISLAKLMDELRSTATWRDIKDLNYSESASLLQEKLDNDAISLPIVGLSVQKGTAILIFMAASLLVALFLHLNLTSANSLYRYPDRVEDLGAAFTSAYIGTSTSWTAKGINYVLLVALPVFIMVMLIRYSYASGSGLFTAAMGLVSVAYAWTAHRNALLMSALARNAQEHWHKEPQGNTPLPVKEHLGDEED